jgi:hypothetical protein
MTRIKALLVAFTLCAAATALAVPVKPDLQKILKQQEHRPRYFEPARAGWNGSEMKRPEDASPNPVLEAYGPKATTRAIRASLMAAAVPDPKAVVAIAAVILLMRVLRTVQERRNKLALVTSPASALEQERKAA